MSKYKNDKNMKNMLQNMSFYHRVHTSSNSNKNVNSMSFYDPALK